MPSTTEKPTQPPAHDWPVYWFAALELAVESGDWKAAAEAQAQLDRLGVTVHYRPRDARRERSRA
jgi:hypothetical protein